VSNLEYYLFTLLIYAAINGLQALGLDMQFGQGGIFNFAYIVLVSVGAYATGIAAVHPAPAHSITQYIGGFGWPFPWDMLFGVAVTVVFALALALICFMRISHWYLALTLASIGYGLRVLATNDVALFNGNIGLAGIPGPWSNQLSPAAYQVVFALISLAALALMYWLFRRVETSPLGRAIRAHREDETAVASLGKSPLRLKTISFLLGSVAAGLGGSLLAIYVGGWNPSAWGVGETFVLLAAIIIGGRGWSAGALFGSVIVLEGIIEGSRFLPEIGGRPGLLPALQGIAVGVILLAVLWWRPWGLWPSPKESFRRGRRKERQPSVAPLAPGSQQG
jgi:branched-chain amino acid transport system permease protein